MKQFILYDGRAKTGGTDTATVIDTASSEQEAERSGKADWAGHDAIWYEYDLNGDKATNEKARWDLPPCGGAR